MKRVPAFAVLLAISVIGCGRAEEQGPAAGETGADTRQGEVAAPAFGEPLAALSDSERARFDDGLDEFAKAEVPADGLGPVFNGTSCAQCHSIPSAGGSGTTLVTRFGRVHNGVFDALDAQGGSLIQTNGLEVTSPACPKRSLPGEAVPSEANVVARRRTTPLFGLGLVDAVPDQTFQRIAQQQRFGSDGVRGVANMVTDMATGRPRVGRFGWKCQNPTLLQFSGDAYLNEMGITSAMFPLDNCPQGDCGLRGCDLVDGIEDQDDDVARFADFMTFLAPPPARPPTLASRFGQEEFSRIGCVTCHVSTLTTGDNPVAALNRVTFHPYSDFLLHDMGALGDGIVQGSAGARQMRTAPLWGVTKQPVFLHDGHATTIEQAILAHDGEGAAARGRFARLGHVSRLAILAFLQSL